MRTLIQIPDEQVQELATLCEEKKISRAEAVRQAIRVYLAENRSSKAMAAGFGLWAGRGIDGLKYEQDMRAEWDR